MIRVADIENDLTGILHGTNLDKINNPYGIIERAARVMLSDVDLDETRRKTELPFVYTNDNQFVVPPDLKGNRIINLNTGDNDIFVQQKTHARNFERDTFSVQHVNGVKTLIVQDFETPEGLVLIAFDSETNKSGVNIENIANDSLDYIQGNSSLRFDQTEQGVFTLTVSNLDVDLMGHVGESNFYCFVKVPPGASLQNITLKAYSSDDDYYTISTNTTAFETSFEEGWNLVKFDWKIAAETGTPNPSAINKVDFGFGETSGIALKNWKVDAIVSNPERNSFVEYYSKYLFINRDGNLSSRISSNSDLVTIDSDSYPMFIAKVAQFAFQQQHDFATNPGRSEVQLWEKEYIIAKRKYNSKNPNQALKPQVRYYKPHKTYNR